MAVVAAKDGALLVATAARAAKATNIQRDDQVSLCLLSDDWYGPWMHVDGKAEVVRMPEALPLLREYQLTTSADFEDWDAFSTRMAMEGRVAIRIVVTGMTQARSSNQRQNPHNSAWST